jgi:hypothetical protein
MPAAAPRCSKACGFERMSTAGPAVRPLRVYRVTQAESGGSECRVGHANVKLGMCLQRVS